MSHFKWHTRTSTHTHTHTAAVAWNGTFRFSFIHIAPNGKITAGFHVAILIESFPYCLPDCCDTSSLAAPSPPPPPPFPSLCKECSNKCWCWCGTNHLYYTRSVPGCVPVCVSLSSATMLSSEVGARKRTRKCAHKHNKRLSQMAFEANETQNKERRHIDVVLLPDLFVHDATTLTRTWHAFAQKCQNKLFAHFCIVTQIEYPIVHSAQCTHSPMAQVYELLCVRVSPTLLQVSTNARNERTWKRHTFVTFVSENNKCRKALIVCVPIVGCWVWCERANARDVPYGQLCPLYRFICEMRANDDTFRTESIKYICRRSDGIKGVRAQSDVCRVDDNCSMFIQLVSDRFAPTNNARMPNQNAVQQRETA